MVALRTFVGVGCALAALVVVIMAWFQPLPELEAEDAREVTRRSLEQLGFEDVRVDELVPDGVYESSTGATIAVWQTTAYVEGGWVDLYIAQDDGVPVYIRDRTSDGTDLLLTEDQYDQLRALDENPVREEQRLHAGVATLAGIFLVLVASAAAAAPGRRDRRRPDRFSI